MSDKVCLLLSHNCGENVNNPSNLEKNWILQNKYVDLSLYYGEDKLEKLLRIKLLCILSPLFYLIRYLFPLINRKKISKIITKKNYAKNEQGVQSKLNSSKGLVWTPLKSHKTDEVDQEIDPYICSIVFIQKCKNNPMEEGWLSHQTVQDQLDINRQKMNLNLNFTP